MLSKIRLSSVSRLLLRQSQQRLFSSAQENVPSSTSQKQVATPPPPPPVTSTFNPEERYKTPDFSEFAYMEYKKYPNHLSHFNRESPDYIPSFRDDFRAEHTTNSYNYYIDRLKSDLQTQRQVHEILRKMDRPYLRGLPGQTRNISAGLQDYSAPLPGVKRGLNDEEQASEFLNQTQRNEDRWMNGAIFYAKYSKMTHYDIEWQKELDARPVNKDFHKVKGYKYDVEVPYEDRYDYLADRLGHPEILGTPAERLLRLEGDIYHPNYLDQPFVKMPSPDPDPALNFEAGEVIYENTQLLEWAKFWKLTTFSAYVFCTYVIPYQLLFKTHLPLEYAFDNLFTQYSGHSMYFWDNNGLHIPIVAGIGLYATHIIQTYMHNYSRDYVVRAQYSKDKELLFVTRISPYGSTEEEVYEMPHIEYLPPSVQGGIQHLSSQDDDGLYDLTCLNTHRQLVFYGGDQYWNPSQRKHFFDRVLNFWTPDYNGLSRIEQEKEDLKNQIILGDDESVKKIEASPAK